MHFYEPSLTFKGDPQYNILFYMVYIKVRFRSWDLWVWSWVWELYYKIFDNNIYECNEDNGMLEGA